MTIKISMYVCCNLIKIKCLLYLKKIVFFGETLTSNNIPFGSCNLTFHSYLTICKTVVYIDQSENNSWLILVLNGRLIAD